MTFYKELSPADASGYGPDVLNQLWVDFLQVTSDGPYSQPEVAAFLTLASLFVSEEQVSQFYNSWLDTTSDGAYAQPKAASILTLASAMVQAAAASQPAPPQVSFGNVSINGQPLKAYKDING